MTHRPNLISVYLNPNFCCVISHFYFTERNTLISVYILLVFNSSMDFIIQFVNIHFCCIVFPCLYLPQNALDGLRLLWVIWQTHSLCSLSTNKKHEQKLQVGSCSCTLFDIFLFSTMHCTLRLWYCVLVHVSISFSFRNLLCYSYILIIFVHPLDILIHKNLNLRCSHCHFRAVCIHWRLSLS